MGKNYYEILEVDKNASYEIIRKAYNTLAKKYHPDLQPDDKKHIAEEKIKLINEAYEIIGNESSRKQYDDSLKQNFVSIDEYNAICLENENLRNIINNLQNKNLSQNDYYTKRIIRPPKVPSNQQQSNNYNKNDFHFKNNFSNSFKNLIALFITIVLLCILWNIPLVQSIIKNILSF